MEGLHLGTPKTIYHKADPASDASTLTDLLARLVAVCTDTKLAKYIP